MIQKEILREIRNRLAETHGARLRGIVLYGSEARGDARPDSDIDLLVLLDGPVHLAEDLMRNIKALYDLSLRINRQISALPVGADEYDRVECPLYQHARHEGVPV